MTEIKIDKLIRSRRRSIGLQITQDATLIVRVPLFAAMHDIQRVIDDRRQWIISKQEMVRLRLASRKQKEFTEGEPFLYLGKIYKLDFVSGQIKPIIFGETIRISYSDKKHVSMRLVAWYKAEALRIIRGRVEHYARSAGITCRSVKISRAKQRWGSCGPSGSLNFNWRLIMAPMFVLDYVVVHELAHIKIRNHSLHFWNAVSGIIPDYKTAEKWLKDHHWELEM